MKPEKALKQIKILQDSIGSLVNEDVFAALCEARHALEKQVPMEPEEVIMENGDQTQTIDLCPMCGSADISEADEWTYCPVCGQKIDWGEDD